MSLFLFLVYVGGLMFEHDAKVGLFDRLTWPLTLGERLAKWAMQNKEGEG